MGNSTLITVYLLLLIDILVRRERHH